MLELGACGEEGEVCFGFDVAGDGRGWRGLREGDGAGLGFGCSGGMRCLVGLKAGE